MTNVVLPGGVTVPDKKSPAHKPAIIRPSVTIKQVDPHGTFVTGFLTDQMVLPTADGGWSTVARGRNVGMVEYVGRSPRAEDVQIMFDGFRTDTSVEPMISRLYNMMLKRMGPRDEPAAVVVRSQLPLSFGDLRWVITAIAPNDEVRRSSDGYRTRALLTVSLMEYVPGDVLVHHKHSPAKSHRNKKAKQGETNHTRTYVLKAGDTLQKIAAHLLGKASRWHEIAKLNNIRDPSHPGKVGRHIKVPIS